MNNEQAAKLRDEAWSPENAKRARIEGWQLHYSTIERNFCIVPTADSAERGASVSDAQLCVARQAMNGSDWHMEVIETIASLNLDVQEANRTYRHVYALPFAFDSKCASGAHNDESAMWSQLYMFLDQIRKLGPGGLIRSLGQPTVTREIQ